ncbi:MAG: hypothetical protein MJE77_45350 [Proteobacteria bacterium]|nr:hypothetical protein [Pseudomonadota bacterium]
MEPWRPDALTCTACVQGINDAKRRRGLYKTDRTVSCRRCGRAGHHHNNCTMPPFSWEGPISDSLEQLHVPLDDEERNQKQDDLATHLANVKRLQWELSNNRGIVIKRRDG